MDALWSPRSWSLVEQRGDAIDNADIEARNCWSDQEEAEVEAFLQATIPPTPAIVVVGRINEWRSVLDWYKGALRESAIG